MIGKAHFSKMQMPALGLVSYSGSHALVKSTLMEKLSEFKILVAKHIRTEDAIIFRQVKLACLDEFVGGPIGLLKMPNA